MRPRGRPYPRGQPSEAAEGAFSRVNGKGLGRPRRATLRPLQTRLPSDLLSPTPSQTLPSPASVSQSCRTARSREKCLERNRLCSRRCGTYSVQSRHSQSRSGRSLLKLLSISSSGTTNFSGVRSIRTRTSSSTFSSTRWPRYSRRRRSGEQKTRDERPVSRDFLAAPLRAFR